MSAHARLSLEGTEQPIVARVESSRGGAIVVGRRLPFLRLGAKVVDELGREGAIRQVSLRIEDGVPHLSLELEYDAPKDVETPPPAVLASSRPPRRDPTIGYESRASRPPAPAAAPSKDDTNHDATLGCAPTEKFEAGFRPSLAPMPLPIPEAPPASVPRAPRRVPGWLVALASLLVAWLRPLPLLGAR